MPTLVRRQELKKPPAGLIKIGDNWHPRRYGLIHQRELKCIYGHRITVGGRPFEVAIPCDSAGEAFKFGMQKAARCDAQLYIFNTRARLLWAMDITRDESELIDRESMAVDQIIDFFGVGFPVDLKILRAASA